MESASAVFALIFFGLVHALPPVIAALGVGSRRALTVVSVLEAVIAILTAILPIVLALGFVLLGTVGGSWILKRRSASSVAGAGQEGDASPRSAGARWIVAATSYLFIALLILFQLFVFLGDLATRHD
jgi:hypothetical protein